MKGEIMIKQTGAALAALTLWCGGAVAQSNPVTDTLGIEEFNWYVRAGAGIGGADNVVVNGQETNDVNLGGRGAAAIGAQPFRYVRGEVEFTLAGNEFDTSLSSRYSQASVLANIILDVPVRQRWSAFVGAGYGFATTELDLDDGLKSQDETDDITQFFIGGAYDLNDRTAIEGALRRIGAAEVDKGGISLSDTESTDLMVSVRYSF